MTPPPPATTALAADRARTVVPAATPPATAAPRAPGFVGRLTERAVRASLARWTGAPLDVVLPAGERLEVGQGPREGAATVVVRDPAFFRKVALRGRLGLGEAYVDGDWTTDDPVGVVTAGLSARAVARRPVAERLLAWFAPRRRTNDRAGSRRNIHAHYDLGNAFYRRWLDPSMTYSAAMFAHADEDLETAQHRKLATMARKARVRPGDRVLEIGCGWGSFALHAAGTLDAHVTGLTVSPAQRALATERVAAAGLADRVDLRLEDWRDTRGRYDAIVSIEMLEAVGRRQWPAWFRAVDALLAPGGVAAVQVICHPDQGFSRYAARTDWIERHVFPGCLLGALGEFTRILARHTSLRIVHVEDLAEHYATTLARWRERFVAEEAAIRALGFDDRFLRLWTWYLASCEAAFATRHLMDLQLVLARDGCRRLDELPPAHPRDLPEGRPA